MNRIKENQSGFSAVELLLIVIIVGLIGTVGYLVYHKQAGQTATMSETKQTATARQTQKQMSTQPTKSYFAIKEWGVEAPYTTQDTFSYSLDASGKLATVASKHLASIDSGCSAMGAGEIRRATANDSSNVSAFSGSGGTTVSQYAQQNPGSYTQVGAYYYQFMHDQSGCGNVSATDQNQANIDLKALVANLQPIN